MATLSSERVESGSKGRALTEMSQRSVLASMAVIAVLALIVRFAMVYKFGVIVEPDTAQYRSLAVGMRNGDLSLDPGFRVPGFPLLLALAGMSPGVTAGIQVALSLIALVLLFDTARFVLKNDRLAVIVTGIYAAWPMYAQYDVSLLSESLATTLTIAGAWSCVKFVKTEESKWLLLAATLSALATLTRPNMIVFNAILPFWAYLGLKAPKDVRLKRFGVAILPALVFIGGWAAFNKSRFGVFNITTIGGFAMTNLTGDIMADMPSGESPLVDTYVRASGEYEKKTGTRVSAVWHALGEIQKADPKPLPELSKEMMTYNIKAIKSQPKRYLGILGMSYTAFWGAPAITPFNPDSLSGKKVYSSLPGIVVKAERAIGWVTRFGLFLFMIFLPWYLCSPGSRIVVARVALLCGAVLLAGLMLAKASITDEVVSLLFLVAAPISLIVGTRKGKPALILLITALAWCMSLICSIPDFGDSRYGAPIAPLIFLALAFSLTHVASGEATSPGSAS